MEKANKPNPLKTRLELAREQVRLLEDLRVENESLHGQVETLTIELDCSKEWLSIKRVAR